jgi:cell division septal protein FtsQ
LVHVGDARFAERLQTYVDLMPALHERLTDIDYVDMRFDDRVYVRSKTAPIAKAARKR